MYSQELEKLLTKYETERLNLKSKSRNYLPYLIALPFAVVGCLIAFTNLSTEPIVFSSFFSIAAAFFLHYLIVGSDFEKLTHKVKSALVKEYMERYHKKYDYSYNSKKRLGASIVNNSKLHSFDKISEEDVLEGTCKNGDFYFSEIVLEDEDSEGNTSTKFRGILFKLKIPGKNFPETRIQNNRGFLNHIFGKYKQNIQFDFWYETRDEQQFHEQMAILFPFIAYLQKSQGELRIKAEGDEIIIMMKSKMKLLDEPEQALDRSFLEERYKENIAKQLNTLLYIVEAFQSDLNSQEIEETLELKELAYKENHFD